MTAQQYNNSNQPAGAAPPRRLNNLITAILLALVALIVAERFVTHGKPLDRDIMAYAVIGHEMLNGRALYSDLFDQKPPAIYVTYAIAEVVAGYGPHTVLLISIVVAIITLLGVYRAGSSMGQGVSSGLWAAAFWAVMSNNLNLDAGSPNAEMFLNACLVWAFALIVRAKGERDGGGSSSSSAATADNRPIEVWRWLAVGALFALASVYKHIAIVSAVFLACVHIAFPPGGSRDRRQAFQQISIAAGVGVVTWLLIFGYFAATNRLEAFYDIFTYNRYYSGGIGKVLSNLVAPFGPQARILPNFLIPLALFAAIGAALSILKNRRLAALLIAFIAATWVEITLPGKFWPHYFQLWLMPLVVGAGWALGWLGRIIREQGCSRWWWLPHATGALLLVTLVALESRLYRQAFVGNWSGIVVSPRFAAADKLAQEINPMLADGETFYVWGDAPALYFWTRRPPPSGLLFTTQMIGGPFEQSLATRVAADLIRTQPEMFIVELAPNGNLAQPELFEISKDDQPQVTVHKAGHPVIDLLAEHYRPLPKNANRGYFVLFVRRGGKLEARLELAATKDQARL